MGRKTVLKSRTTSNETLGFQVKFILSLIRKLIFPTLLVISIAFSGMLLVSSTVFNFAAAAIGAATGVDRPKVRSADDVARFTADIDEQKRINRELRSEVADRNAELVLERRTKRELRSQVVELGQDLATAKIARDQLRNTVGDVAHRVTTRATKTATRETASMAGEAIPFWGTAVIVTATTLELYDLCQTVVDMNELQTALDPDLATPIEDLTVCGMVVPTRHQLWESVSSTPSAAWSSAQEIMPSLDDVKSFELPEIDWQSISSNIRSTASSVGTGMSDAASSLTTTTSDVAATKWDQLKKWYDD
jgi:hypothetical protein